MARKALEVNNTLLSAVQDDGTAEGILKSKILSGDLIKVPISALKYTRNVVSPASGFTGTSDVNTDGSNATYNLTAQAGIPNECATLNILFFGRTCGLRYRGVSTKTSFSLVIDGTPIDKHLLSTKSHVSVGGYSQDDEISVILDDNLSDGAHTLSIIVYPDSNASKTLVIYGMILESKAGYKKYAEYDFITSTGTLTLADVTIPTTNNRGRVIKSVKSITYSNTTATEVTVTIKYNNVLYLKEIIPANSSKMVNLSNSGINPNLFTHNASTASAISFYCLGQI